MMVKEFLMSHYHEFLSVSIELILLEPETLGGRALD